MEKAEDRSRTSNQDTTTPDPYPSSIEIAAASQEPSANNSVESAAPAEKDHEHLTGIRLLVLSFTLVLVGFLLLLDTSIVSTAIPRITSDFHSLGDVSWYGTSYLLANCALQPLSGKIYVHFNSKRVFLCFFAIFELGSAVCGAANSSKMLIVGRAIAGIGASGLMNGAYNIIHHSIAPDKHSFYLGILIGISQLGVVAGPLIGGVLTEYTSWRWCFYINLPCGALVFIGVLLVPILDNAAERSEKRTLLQKISNLDLIGFTLFAPATIQFILSLQWGGTKYQWNSATIIGLFCGALGTLLVFAVWEHRMKDDAMIPLSVIGNRVTLMSCLNNGSLLGALLAGSYFLPIYFQAVRNATPTLSGVNLLPSIITTLIFGVFTGALVQRIGFYLPFAVMGGILHTVGFGLTTTLTPTTNTGAWIGYQIIQGAGRGLSFIIPIVAVQNNAPPKQISIANALVVFSQNFGGVIVLSLCQVVFNNRLRHGLSIYAPDVDAEIVIKAGAAGVRQAVSEILLPGVLLAYSKAFDNVMYLGTAAAAAQLLFAFGMGWKNIKKKKGPSLPDAPEKAV